MMLAEFIDLLQRIFDEAGNVPVVSENPDGGDPVNISVSTYLDSPSADAKVTHVCIDVIYLDSDVCPECGTGIEISDGMDGRFYIYCPSCGPIPELADVTELDDTHILGYPPFLEEETHEPNVAD